MKDGRITQDGKYNDILKFGSDFMELVGAHKEALSALDSIEAGAAVVGEDSSTGNAKNFLQKKESPTDQNDKTDNAMETNGQLIQAESDSPRQRRAVEFTGRNSKEREALAAEGISFEVLYYPRVGMWDFVVSANKVEDSLSISWTSSMRVKT
ncbi:Multidrug resistance-associated protein/mitoxantrone resistance protein [Forsythia ovata]|uniref:Multidrug resistance-associated protein/mitoxantrone resistance protein n=1 Tax=Forsythia ovata TaxID=205694 RepID=A0ABD1PVS3_9LAMI